MLSTTEETIQKFMNSQLGKENAVERVKKIKDYAFVHFKDRDDALQAMELTNSKTLFSISPAYFLGHLSHSSDQRPWNINSQDWKYTLFVVFIRHSQNIRHHNALSDYRLYGGRHRKHWIETLISKLIFDAFNFT